MILRVFLPSFEGLTPITVKFTDADDKEVKEQLHCWEDRNNKAKLIEVYKEVIEFGTMYGYGEMESHKLAQALSRALSRNACKKWIKIQNAIKKLESVDETKL